MSDVPLLNTTVMSLYSKYVKNCNIFGQILNIWVKLILRKISIFFFNVYLCLRTLKVLALKICAVLFRSVSTTDVGDCALSEMNDPH